MLDKLDTEAREMLAAIMLEPPPTWKELDMMWDVVFREVLKNDYIWAWDKDRMLGRKARKALN